MTTMTIQTTTTNDFDAAFDAGEITWAEIDMPTYAPASIIYAPTQDSSAYLPENANSEQVAYDAQALAAELSAEMFRLGGKALRKIAYTPTGRTRTTAEAQAAQAEITRRASK